MVQACSVQQIRPLALPVAGVVVAMVLVVISPRGQAVACSCVPPPPPQQALDEADAVFAGAVVHVTPDGEWINARIEVTEVWKGVVHEVVEVRTHSQGAMCGYGFAEGRTDIVYASTDSDGRLSTHLCTRSAALSGAESDRDALGAGSEPLPGSSASADGRSWVSPTIAVAGLTVVAVLVWRALGRRSSE